MLLFALLHGFVFRFELMPCFVVNNLPFSSLLCSCFALLLSIIITLIITIVTGVILEGPTLHKFLFEVCVDMYVLFYVCVGTGFVDQLEKIN